MLESSKNGEITVIFRGNKQNLPANLTVAQVLKRMKMSPESYLVVRNGELITEDQMLRPGDQIRVVPVISGGDH